MKKQEKRSELMSFMIKFMINDGYNLSIICQFPRSLTNIHGLIRQGSLWPRPLTREVIKNLTISIKAFKLAIDGWEIIIIYFFSGVSFFSFGRVVRVFYADLMRKAKSTWNSLMYIINSVPYLLLLATIGIIVISKNKASKLSILVETFNEAGKKVAFNQSITFIQNAGGFGGRRNSKKIKPILPPPSRQPDASITEPTSINQVRNNCHNDQIQTTINYLFYFFTWWVSPLGNVMYPIEYIVVTIYSTDSSHIAECMMHIS